MTVYALLLRVASLHLFLYRLSLSQIGGTIHQLVGQRPDIKPLCME
jgi:hypothetical protein